MRHIVNRWIYLSWQISHDSVIISEASLVPGFTLVLSSCLQLATYLGPFITLTMTFSSVLQLKRFTHRLPNTSRAFRLFPDFSYCLVSSPNCVLNSSGAYTMRSCRLSQYVFRWQTTPAAASGGPSPPSSVLWLFL